MARYRFIGSVETVLSGLVHGVNARLHRDGHGQPDGSTVVAQPGDVVEVDGDYPHALLEPAKAPAKKAAPAPAPPATPAATAAPTTTGSEG